jgi:hypothetical protein
LALKEADIKGNPFAFIPHKGYGSGRAPVFAGSAPHAKVPFQRGGAVHADRGEGTGFLASPAPAATRLVNMRYVSGRSHRGNSVPLHGFDPSAAAFAAVTDGVEPVEQRVFEPRRVHVASLVFFPKDIQGFGLRETATAVRVVLQDEVHERLSRDQTHLGRMTRTRSSVPAAALVGCEFGGSFKHQLPRHRVGDDLLEVSSGYIFFDLYDSGGLLMRQNLAMVAV